MLRAVFMGSDSFSAPILTGLLDGAPSDLEVEIVGVVTQPDRQGGRGRRLRSNPVKELAEARALPVIQPERVREPHSLQSILAFQPDLIVLASFGQLLPRALLEAPPIGCLNLHPSLLPRYRGPSPVVGTLLAGDRVTGTTLMKMVVRMDAGPILGQREIEVGWEETGAELEARLSLLSKDLLIELLPAWVGGRLQPRPQDEEAATYTSLLKKEDGRIDWDLPAEQIARMVLAYNPWPSAFASWNGRQVSLLRARAQTGNAEPGRVVGMEGPRLLIGTAEGLLAVSELQLAGARALPATDIVRGHPGLLSAQLN